MKTKFLLAILTLVLLSTTVSAIENLTISPKEGTFRKSVNSVEFTLSNSGASDLNLSFSSPVRILGENGYILPISLKDEAGNTITSPIVVASGSKKIKAEITAPEWNNFKLGDEYSTTLVLAGTTGNETLTFSLVDGFCKLGDFGELEITDFDDKEKDNTEAWDWQPLDNVEFSVEVENNFDDDKRITVKYDIYNEAGKKVDFDNEDKEQSVSIDSGDSEKVTFSLVVPADIDDGEYKLFVKAYVKGREGELTNADAGCIDHSSVLDSEYYQKLSISRDEDRAVVVDMDSLTPLDVVKCGDTVTLYTKIYNIGTEDEDKVKVNLYNKVLGIDLNEVINSLDTGESATLTFNFKTPENVEGKSYPFELTTFYEYDKDDDEYDSNSKDDLDKDFDFDLKVECVEEAVKSASITAELDSDALAGGELKIKGTLSNTGEEETTYTLSVADYEEWAELGKITPSTFTLEAGESKDFSLTLNVNEGAEGEQSLTIEASYDGETTEQEVSVVLEGKTSGITGAAIATHFRENWFIWVIIVINIVLIIAIIVVARRIVTAR